MKFNECNFKTSNLILTQLELVIKVISVIFGDLDPFSCSFAASTLGLMMTTATQVEVGPQLKSSDGSSSKLAWV